MFQVLFEKIRISSQIIWIIGFFTFFAIPSNAWSEVSQWGAYGDWSVQKVEENGRRWCNLVTGLGGPEQNVHLFVVPVHDSPRIAMAFYLFSPGETKELWTADGAGTAQISIDGSTPYSAPVWRDREKWLRVAAAYPEGPQLIEGMKAGNVLLLRFSDVEIRASLRGFTRALREFESCEQSVKDGA